MLQRKFAAIVATTLLALPIFAAEGAVKSIGTAPADLAPPVKARLPGDGLVVEIGGAPVAEFWFRREIETREGGRAKLGVEFAAIAEGSLIGAVRFPAGFRDYMKNDLSAGTYTLRYGVQPADGNHMGVSINRDFLLVVPAAQDTDPKAMAYADLVAASRKATGTSHPGVLSLFPLASGAKVPAIVPNELDQPMLAVEVGGIRLGLVVKGEGEH